MVVLRGNVAQQQQQQQQQRQRQRQSKRCHSCRHYGHHQRFILVILCMILGITWMTNIVFLHHVHPPESSLGAGDSTTAAAVSGADGVVSPVPQQQHSDRDRVVVVSLLREAGVPSSTLSERMSQLPTWNQVRDLYGDHAIVYNEDVACRAYRERVPPERRMLGAAGMFSTGTNLVTTLLKKNCVIPERLAKYGPHATKEQYGIRWQVPWGKHTQAQYREAHAATHAKEINKDDVLPIITIRHPIAWINSMCKNPYTAQWKHTPHKCPNLRNNHRQPPPQQQQWNNVTVQYGAGPYEYQSLVHLYNDWYHGYTQHAASSYPWIMIRMEDLIFHANDTIHRVCACAGGIVTNNPIQNTLESAKKDSPGHDTSTGLIEAWIKYSQMPQPVQQSWSPDDIQATQQALDPQLVIQQFQYQLPF